MKNLNHLDKYRIPFLGNMGDEHNGAFEMHLEGSNITFLVIASDGNGWDHVSVSTEYRCPKWLEMKQVKELFFEDEEAVVQYHPPASAYVDNHKYCLHLWRSQEFDIPMPESILTGVV